MSAPRHVVLVTGSSRGIGLAAAIALAREGFAVAVNGPSDEAELRAAVAEVSAIGPCVAAPFDVSDLTAHDAALVVIEAALGPLTTLVNNAGVGVLSRSDLLDVTEASWDRCLTVNAKAMFFLTQAFAKRLLSRQRYRGGRPAGGVLRQQSHRCDGFQGPCRPAGARKYRRVRCATRPDRHRNDPPVIEMYRKRAEEGLTLFPRVGLPEEVDAIIASLATGKLPYSTGQVISADAGMLVPRF